MQNVIDAFTRECAAIERLQVVLRSDASLTETLSGFDFSMERSRLTTVLDEFEATRREARLAAWRLMAAEGCSIGEMARIFGLSRQLISRQLRLVAPEDSRRPDDNDEPPPAPA